jgi:hypothetical protein
LKKLKGNGEHSFFGELKWLFVVSFSVFLFILFFQPFPLEMLDYNNRLLYVAGFWAITIFIFFIVLNVLPFLSTKWLNFNDLSTSPALPSYLIIMLLTMASYSFYIHFVGKTPLTLYILFKILLVCLIPIIILFILHRNESLEHSIQVLHDLNKEYTEKLKEYSQSTSKGFVKILSSNKNDIISLKLIDLILINSADNYVEIHYLEDDIPRKKMLRNTLKEIANQLSDHDEIIYCHRTALVNTLHIEALHRSYSGYYLKVKQLDLKVPVSRQYVKKIRNNT